MKKGNYNNLDKVNLSFTGKSFKIEGNVTVCEVTSTLRIRLGKTMIKEINYVTKGIATCSKDDKFDEKKGKYISSARAESEAYSLAIAELRKTAKGLVDLSAACDARCWMMSQYKWKNKRFVYNISRDIENQQF